MIIFLNDAAPTEIYTLSLHAALPISTSASGPTSPRRSASSPRRCSSACRRRRSARSSATCPTPSASRGRSAWQEGRCEPRSEEHTSELQSRQYLVCRLLLEKKNNYTY